MKKSFVFRSGILSAALALLLLLGAMLLPLEARAAAVDSGTFGASGDNLSWTLSSNGTLTISGTGKMESFGWVTDVPWFEYADSIQKVVIKSGVTNVSSYAFNGYKAMTTLTLPTTLTTIDFAAFTNCTALTAVDIPKSVKTIGENAFSDCEKLATVIIRNGVTKIKDYAFYNCTALKEVTIGSNVSSIGAYAFYPCFELGDVYYRGTKSEWKALNISDGNWYLEEARIHYNADTQTHTYTAKTVKPNCTRTGYTAYTCTCGISYKDNLKDAKWHSYKATSVSSGRTTYTCSVCSNSYTENTASNVPVLTSNKNMHVYDRWAAPMTSFLSQNESGTFTRVQQSGSRVHIEQYNSKFQFMSHKEIPLELPLFGGHYFDGTYHFLVFGQNNPNERDDMEVFRVVKYDSSWKRLGAACSYGFDTTIPFRAGSLRMTSMDGILYVRTCHQMYTRDDGLRHQANISLHVNIADMTFADTYTYGYASHSFNQFIINDGTYIVKADHGDAYPRSVVLYRDGTQVEVLPIKGNTGDNSTGVNLGGLAASGSNYLVVGNSIKQSSSASFSGQRNIFVTVTSKSNFSEDGTKLIWLTSHSSGVTVSTPQLVKISNSKFCVLWTENGKLCYTFLNGLGKRTTDIFRKSTGALSDCQPIYANGVISWYVSDGSTLKFYSINPETNKISVSAAYGTKTGPTIKSSNVASSGKIKLTWNAVDGATKYKVFRATSRTGTYKLMKTTTACSYTNTSAAVGTKYYYYVLAVDSSGVMSKPSNTISRTCDCAQPVVTLSNVASTGKIKISWESVEGAVSYKIYRSATKNGTYKLLKTTTNTSHVNSNAETGDVYYYKVKAIGKTSAADSAFSPAKYRTCDLPRPVISLSNDAATGKIKISWEPVEGAVSYKVYRSTSKDGTYTRLVTTTNTSHVNNNAVPGVAYYYKVLAVARKSAANSAYSSAKYRTCDLPQPVLSVSLSESGRPVLTWDPIEGAAAYTVYRSDSADGTFTALKTVTEPTHTNENAVAGETYYYKVIAVCDPTAGNSASSNIVSITAESIPEETEPEETTEPAEPSTEAAEPEESIGEE